MFELISCGYNFIHRNGLTIDRPAGSGNYAFVLFKSSSEVILNGRIMPVEKNTYVLFRPTTRYIYRDAEKPFINDWFHVDGADLEAFLERTRFPLDTPVKAVDPLLISRCIMELTSIHRSAGSFREEIIDSEIRTLLMKLCHLLERPALNDKASRYYLQFSRLRNELFSSPETHRSVETLATYMNLSKSYFQHIYKELFGCSVVTDIINSRLEHAKYLLKNSSLSISAISAMCGYENDTHFMRQFKKFVGVTPSQYKSKH
ncbi:helix-turn-helix domain-containing protein [Paenibacillus chartarius]|uniref:Helix-turn-helix domain-containing protein n=1 Tax=Paenibacillus chartarius TaxID=747481 RepID=A0ABV6DJF9_9BACL